MYCIISNTTWKIPLWLREARVQKRIEKLNLNKSPGQDCLHPRVLKELSHVIATQLFLILWTIDPDIYLSPFLHIGTSFVFRQSAGTMFNWHVPLTHSCSEVLKTKK